MDTIIAHNQLKPVKLRIAASVWARWQTHHLAPGKRVETLSYAFAHASPLPGSALVCVGPFNPLVMLAPDCFERLDAAFATFLEEVKLVA